MSSSPNPESGSAEHFEAMSPVWPDQAVRSGSDSGRDPTSQPSSASPPRNESIVARDQFSLRALLCWVTLLGLGFGLVRLHPGFALLVYFVGSAFVLYGSLGVMTLGDPRPVLGSPEPALSANAPWWSSLRTC
jgi:hypothetical protein